MAQKKYVDLTALSHYDAKLKAHIEGLDTATLNSAKTYADGLAGNYDAAGTAQTKVNELANGQVKTNTEAIAAINDESTGILKQAKDYADGKDSAIAEAKKAGTDAQAAADAAQSDVDDLAAKVGTVADGQTVMGIIQNIQENAYDDTEIRGLIQGNADDIDGLEGRATTVEGKVDTLIGEDLNKSVRTIANEELAKQLIAENAAESLNELAEIAAWIQSHPNDASAMNKAITDLETLVGTLPEGVSATTIVGYVQELVNAEKSRAEGIESGLDSRLKVVEGQLGTGTGSVSEQINSAKAEAIAEAAADATSKANTAEANAKAYTDEQIEAIDLSGIEANANEISGLKNRMTTAEGKISTIETAIAEGGSVMLAIADAKKAGTDAQADVDALEGTVNTLSGKVNTNESNISAHGDRLTALEEKVGDGFVAITNAEIDALFA